MATKSKIETIAGSDDLRWNVSFTKEKYRGKVRKMADFHRYTHACQDFTFTVEYHNLSDIPAAVKEYHDSFDPSYETSLWLDETGHGKSGAPYEMKDILEDMEWVKSSILKLYNQLKDNV